MTPDGPRGELQLLSARHGGLACDWLKHGHVVVSWEREAERELVRVEGEGLLGSSSLFSKGDMKQRLAFSCLWMLNEGVMPGAVAAIL